jgi:hypothetical protein
MRFESGLELDLQDGRVRQGDAVTTYKAQGASRTEMIRVEDNRSLQAMATREDLHVAFTRHRATARMFVQDVDLLCKVSTRSAVKKVSARELLKLETNIEQVMNYVRSAAETQFRKIRQGVSRAMARRRDLIFELRLRKRRAEELAMQRKRNWGMSI